MTSDPTVSVLLPVRNAASTLPRALDSLLAQTFSDFECVVVDDGSDDGTPDVLSAYVRRDDRIRTRRIEPSGIVAALDLAARSARGTLLARQDADDVSLPERFDAQVEFLRRRPEIGLVATQVAHVGTPLTDGGKRYLDWVRSCREPEEIANGLWIESPLPHPTVLMRRVLFERVGGYRDQGWPEDYDLWLRMLRAGTLFGKVDRDLYEWTDAPERASRTQPQYAPDRFLACRAHHLAGFLGERDTIVWGAGRDGRRFARAFLSEGGRVSSFLDIDPRKIGRKAYGRPIEEAQEGLAKRGSRMILVAVGAKGARELIRAALGEASCAEGRDYVCVA
ncbi:MAG: glycosyltransferase [Candidatus Eisenbacteria bacterium]|uniref:Glycosyltransferase n=1 Tax=Eiseniibacteriota bacterium TaxID=2212470 RepID=A0A956NCM6_UNCEI|nr:glycosyltransferase [Candidatus Eisenbacteria bacterium]MCB9465502.1 glycosyltransferase [Candidatus Eisenbacteria bacterium]